MSPPYGFIYLIENLETGKLYIGQTIKPAARFRYHRNPSAASTAIARSIKKYGKDRFDFVFLERCDSAEELNERETYWITTLETLVPNGYNLNNGGNSRRASQETLEKMRASMLGKNVGSENGMYGRLHTKQAKAKISASSKGKNNSMYGKPGTRRGAFVSEETRAKLSRAKIGQMHTEEAKKKISKSHTGKSLSKEHKQKIAAAIYDWWHPKNPDQNRLFEGGKEPS